MISFISPRHLALILVMALGSPVWAQPAADADAKQDANAQPANLEAATTTGKRYVELVRGGKTKAAITETVSTSGMAARLFGGAYAELSPEDQPKVHTAVAGVVEQILGEPRAVKALKESTIDDFQARAYPGNLIAVEFRVSHPDLELPVNNRLLLEAQAEGDAWKVIDFGVGERMLSRGILTGFQQSKLSVLEYLEVLSDRLKQARNR